MALPIQQAGPKTAEAVAIEAYERRKKKKVSKQSNNTLRIVVISVVFAIVMFMLGALTLMGSLFNGYMFSMEATFTDSLNAGTVDKQMVDTFQSHGITITENAIVNKIDENHWRVTEGGAIWKIDRVSSGGVYELKVFNPGPVYWLDFFIFGLLIMIGPYSFYAAAQYARIKAIEKRLPEFLRDVAEAGRFGMILADAVVVASSGRYGLLTPEIKRMAAQIRWGVPVSEAMRLFAERVNTPMVNRIVAIIMKSNDAGGNVADVLALVSHTAKEDLISEEERGISMSTYVAVVYISFFVFLVVILVLTGSGSFLEKMELAGQAVQKGLKGQTGAITLQTSYIPQVAFALVIAALAHAIGDGLLAGVLQNGQIPYGMRHSFILLLMGYMILRFMMRKDYLLGGIGV